MQAALEEGQHVILVFWVVRLQSRGGQPAQLAQHARLAAVTGRNQTSHKWSK
jgi:hypothetical protein